MQPVALLDLRLISLLAWPLHLPHPGATLHTSPTEGREAGPQALGLATRGRLGEHAATVVWAAGRGVRDRMTR